MQKKRPTGLTLAHIKAFLALKEGEEPSTSALAERLGKPQRTVQSWDERGSIAKENWKTIEELLGASVQQILDKTRACNALSDAPSLSFGTRYVSPVVNHGDQRLGGMQTELAVLWEEFAGDPPLQSKLIHSFFMWVGKFRDDSRTPPADGGKPPDEQIAESQIDVSQGLSPPEQTSTTARLGAKG